MTNQTNLKKELESFKSQMKEVNESLSNFEASLHVEQIKIHTLRTSFANIVKLINHELIESLDSSRNLIEQLRNK